MCLGITLPHSCPHHPSVFFPDRDKVAAGAELGLCCDEACPVDPCPGIFSTAEWPMMEQLEGKDRRKEGGTSSHQFHLGEQRGCRSLGLTLDIFARRIYFSSSIWKLHIFREGEGVATHYTDQWVSYLMVEAGQVQVKGLPGDGGRAQQEPHSILVGTETGGVSATL